MDILQGILSMKVDGHKKRGQSYPPGGWSFFKPWVLTRTSHPGRI